MIKKIFSFILINCFIFISGCLHQTVTIEKITSQFYDTHKVASDTYFLFYNQQDLYNEKIYEQLLPILEKQHIIITDNFQNAQYALTFNYIVKDYSYTSTQTSPIYGYNGYNLNNIIGYTTSNKLELQFAHGIIISAYEINKDTTSLSNKLWEILSVTSADHSQILKTLPTLLLALQKYISSDTQGRYKVVVSFDDKIITEKKIY